MTPALIAFIFSLGVTAWAYTKLQNRSGYGNTGTVVKGVVAVFILCFIVAFSIAVMIF